MGSRGQILEVAERLFAAGGFHGTSVEEIAAQAGLNKATIYYYFSSKQAILDELTESFLQSFLETASPMLRHNGFMGVLAEALPLADGSGGGESADEILPALQANLDSLLDFFIARRDMLRIMFSEVVKDGENQALLFRLSDILTTPLPLRERMRATEPPGIADELIVIRFFGGLLPIAYFAACSIAWSAHYDMDKARLREGLHQLFRMQILGYRQLMENRTGGEAAR